MLGKKPT